MTKIWLQGDAQFVALISRHPHLEASLPQNLMQLLLGKVPELGCVLKLPRELPVETERGYLQSPRIHAITYLFDMARTKWAIKLRNKN